MEDYTKLIGRYHEIEARSEKLGVPPDSKLSFRDYGLPSRDYRLSSRDYGLPSRDSTVFFSYPSPGDKSASYNVILISVKNGKYCKVVIPNSSANFIIIRMSERNQVKPLLSDYILAAYLRKQRRHDTCRKFPYSPQPPRLLLVGNDLAKLVAGTDVTNIPKLQYATWSYRRRNGKFINLTADNITRKKKAAW